MRHECMHTAQSIPNSIIVNCVCMPCSIWYYYICVLYSYRIPIIGYKSINLYSDNHAWLHLHLAGTNVPLKINEHLLIACCDMYAVLRYITSAPQCIFIPTRKCIIEVYNSYTLGQHLKLMLYDERM